MAIFMSKSLLSPALACHVSHPAGFCTIRVGHPGPVERLVLPDVLFTLSNQERMANMTIMQVL